MSARHAVVLIVFPLCLFCLFAHAQDKRPPSPCESLSRVLGNKVAVPSDSAYNASVSSYWSSRESALAPRCVVLPKSAADVSLAVGTLHRAIARGQNVTYAVRGGGHTPWPGSANVADGVTVDLRGVAAVELSADGAVARVGAGARWGDVYTTLERQGRTVIGGRGASIGVGGLTTGGGISYYSARRGFACDNVVGYELVRADGTTTYASARRNPDLFRALKGGSNNLGVVTRFDLRTFAAGPLWGGTIVYNGSEATPALLKAFADYDLAHWDPDAHLILSFSWVAQVGAFVSANIEYTKPTPNPPIFRALTAARPQLSNTMRIASQPALVQEFVDVQPRGRRQAYVTSTFRHDGAALRDLHALGARAARTLPQTAGVTLSFSLQPLGPAVAASAAAAATSRDDGGGANSLGLEPGDGPLVLCLLALSWDDPAQDGAVRAVAQRLEADIVGLTRARGLWHRFVYLNYAAEWQDPIAGYGAANGAALRAASREHDPEGVFQKNVPGGFKLFGSS